MASTTSGSHGKVSYSSRGKVGGCLLRVPCTLFSIFLAFRIALIHIPQIGTQNAAGDIHDDIVQASRADQQELITYLERIAQSDQMIIEALRSDNLRLEETMIALMKVTT